MTGANRGLQGAIAGGDDTIVALGTPPGRSAIAIIRMSGADATRIASQHLDPWPVDVREMRLCAVTAGAKLLDHALVAVYRKPDSFTGEDVVEIFTHGGYIVPASVLSALIESGARQATAGEFTRRAVLNGKLDIVQAEAIGDLIDARSGAMQQAALYQLDGGLSARIAALRRDVIELESLIAYDVDFPEEDDGPVSRERVSGAGKALLGSIDLLLATIPVGQIVREGAVVVIAGEPNVGKSSLFNAILGERRAIVTEISGTTRDAIEAVVDAGRWPIRLIDTAGLRESTDVVERLGIETSEHHIGSAHIVLACGDSEESLERTISAISKLSIAPVVSVLTKSDLNETTADFDAVRVSAVTGTGLQQLKERIDRQIDLSYGEIPVEMPVLMKTRHIQAITSARREIEAFNDAWERRSLPTTVAAVHLRAAALALEDVIGAISTEDVLDRVFSSFCVGK